jgi:hypothetical protein
MRLELLFHQGQVLQLSAFYCNATTCSTELILSYNLDSEERTWANVSYAGVEPGPAPIPAAAWLFGSALLGLGAMKRKRT